MDMSGVNTTTAMIDNNPNLHPAVLSANITVTPIEVTQPRTRSELGWGGGRGQGGGGLVSEEQLLTTTGNGGRKFPLSF